MRFISKLEIKNGYLVKGRQLEGNRKIGNPLDYAIKYYNSGVDEIFFFDIVASLYNSQIINQIVKHVCSKIFIPFAVGGGVRNLDDCKKLFESGADKIHLNSVLFEDLKLIDEFSKVYGSQSISIEVQTKKIKNEYYCFFDRGREFSNITLSSWLKKLKDFEWGEIIITDIDRDGMNNGANMELIKIFRSFFEDRHIIYSGGFNPKIDNYEKLDLYLDGLLVASALHNGLVNVKNYSQRLRNEKS